MATKLAMNYVPAIDYCEAVIDGTHDSPKQVEDGRKLVTSKNIIGGKLDLENCYNISEEDFEQINKRSKVYEWDILMSMIGTVGEICLLKEEPDYAIKNMGVFRAKNESDAKWLYYYLTSPSAQYAIYARLRGSTQKFLPLGELRSFPILKPENEEIKSKIINQLFSIDCLISCKERLNEKVSELISTLFRSWFIDFDPVRAKAQGRLPFGMDEETAALFPDSLEDSKLGPIPAGWTVGTISEFGKIVTGRTPSSKNPEHFDGPVPFITIPDLARDIWQEETERTISQAGAESLKSALIPANSVCVSCIATVGNVGITTRPSITNQQIHSIICDKGYSSQFVYSLMTSFVPNLKFFAGGGAVVQNISKSMFGKQHVIIPPIRVVEQFTGLTEHLFQSIKATNSTSRSLILTKDALLPRLMSGELSVS
jgi:type I restriction enzyme, S subunit